MTQATNALGRRGEDIACEYLRGKGYAILARNWRSGRTGELDIVAQRGRQIVVVEVKTRAGRRFGPPLAAITWQKQQRLRGLAIEWMRAHDTRAPLRIDAIGIELPASGHPCITHVEGI